MDRIIGAHNGIGDYELVIIQNRKVLSRGFTRLGLRAAPKIMSKAWVV
jgi:hypothetical protein